MAGKPIATSRGAATAAGVPKPDAPSINEPNILALFAPMTAPREESSAAEPAGILLSTSPAVLLWGALGTAFRRGRAD